MYFVTYKFRDKSFKRKIFFRTNSAIRFIEKLRIMDKIECIWVSPPTPD